jgi:CheY-like chemotaxis protein
MKQNCFERNAASDRRHRLTTPGNAAWVLVVDDDDLLRWVLAEQLSDAGFRVWVAANGNEAITRLMAGEPADVLVTDFLMPDMDGLAVIRAAQEARPRLPAVLLTGYLGNGLTSTVPEAVAGSYLVLRKPFRLQELVDLIQPLLSGRETPDPLLTNKTATCGQKRPSHRVAQPKILPATAARGASARARAGGGGPAGPRGSASRRPSHAPAPARAPPGPR